MDDQAIERIGHGNLAAQPAFRSALRGHAVQHFTLHQTRRRHPRNITCGIDVDMACRAGAGAAALTGDSGYMSLSTAVAMIENRSCASTVRRLAGWRGRRRRAASIIPLFECARHFTTAAPSRQADRPEYYRWFVNGTKAAQSWHTDCRRIIKVLKSAFCAVIAHSMRTNRTELLLTDDERRAERSDDQNRRRGAGRGIAAPLLAAGGAV